MCDIGFSDASYDTLKIQEDCGLYPPRFKVIISCSPTAQPAIARVEFRGAVNDLIFDIPLHVFSLCKCTLYSTIFILYECKAVGTASPPSLSTGKIEPL